MGRLSNALNKAGICQEIDFKRFDYLEYSIRHRNHSSIFGITTTGIVQSLYSSRHAFNQGFKGHSLPCINDCLSQFRQISRLLGTCIHGACYFGPHVLYRIHIWRHCWLFHMYDPFSFHEINHCACSVRPGVVILVRKIMPKRETINWQ